MTRAALLVAAALTAGAPVAHAQAIESPATDAIRELASVREVAEVVRTGEVDLDGLPQTKSTIASIAAIELSLIEAASASTAMVGGDPAEDGPARPPVLGYPMPGAFDYTLRKTALQSIVRITASSQQTTTTCTGTVVAWNNQDGVLLAAHCLYPLSPSGQLGYPRRATLYAHGLGTLTTSDAKVPTGFDGCAKTQSSYTRCADTEPDVAFVPVTLPFGFNKPWSVCAAPETRVTAFGYGVDSQGRDGRLLMGAFDATEAAGERQWVGTPAVKWQQVWSGDSGGPVLSAADDEQLGTSWALGVLTPRVCFVIASRGAAQSYFEPAWTLDAAFAEP